MSQCTRIVLATAGLTLGLCSTGCSAAIVVGAGNGPASVAIINSDLSASSFAPYPAAVNGVRVAQGDVNGDGLADIITGAGVNGHVKAFSGAGGGGGAELSSFFAFAGFTGAVNVAAGDINGDGIADIVTGVDSVSSHVKAFSGVGGAELSSFFAFGAFSGGVRVASGDINGDGRADIITGVGSGAAAATNGHVKVFSGSTGAELTSFFAFPGLASGVHVASGDINGDGRDDVIVGVDGGVGGHVKVFSGTNGSELLSFFAYDVNFVGGVRIAAADVNGDGRDDIITGSGPGSPGGHVKVFSGIDNSVLNSFLAFGTGVDGAFVAGYRPIPAPSTLALLVSAGFFAAQRRRQH